MPSSTSSDRPLHRGATALAVSVLTLLGGCALLPANDAPSASPTTAPPITAAPASSPTASPSARSPGPTAITPEPIPAPTFSAGPATSTPAATGADLAASFARFADTQPGQLAVAVTAVGGSTEPLAFGGLGSPVAWSTSKVPIAIAVERTDRAQGLRTTMRQAITASDNEAAETLWQSLGTAQVAAAATDEVLRDYGDPTTRTQSEQVRPPYTAFGQTRWSLTDQARFGASLSCRPEATSVYAAMGQVVADQRWGLGTIPGAHFKGGWGPSSTGYLVRQLGVIDTQRGWVAVALAVEAPSFQQGTATLSQTARWLRSHADDLPAGTCSR
jgi:hypothetical protein